jgi:cytochrome c oxidase assembly protein Cox11
VPAEAVVEMRLPEPSQLEKLFSKPPFCSKFVVQPPVVVVETVMVKLQVAILLAASFAVKMTFVVPIGKFAPLAKLLEIVVAVQLSVAVGAVNVAVAVVPEVVKFCEAGQFESTGGVTSGAHGLVNWVTFIEKLHVEILFAASFAVKMTFVVPIGKFAPLAKLLEIVAAVQLSVAVGAVNVAVAVVPDVVKFCEAGQLESTGGVTSGAHGLTAPFSERQTSSMKTQPAKFLIKPISTQAVPVGATDVSVPCSKTVADGTMPNGNVFNGVNALFKYLM